MTKLKVIVPFYLKISDATERSLAALEASDIECEVLRGECALIFESRNISVLGRDNTLKYPELPDDFTHCLFVDSDIEFSVDAVRRLLRHNMPVVSGAYLRRGMDEYCCGWLDGPMVECNRHVPTTATGLVEVDWFGAGFLLVARDVLEKIQWPWFHHHTIETEDEATETSEDIGFCIRLQSKGVIPYIDTDCIVTHHTNRREAYGMNTPQQATAKPKGRDLGDIELENMKALNNLSTIIGRNTEQLLSGLNSAVEQIRKLQTENAQLKKENDELQAKLATPDEKSADVEQPADETPEPEATQDPPVEE